MTRRCRPQRKLRAVHTKYSGIPAWSTLGRCYAGSGQEAKLHQAMPDFRGKFQTVEHRVLPVGKIQDGWLCGNASTLSLLETQLHDTFRIGELDTGVKHPYFASQPRPC